MEVSLFDNYLFSCHSLGDILGDSGGITDKQLVELERLQDKLTRTVKQEKDMEVLLEKKNAERKLPDTCTSYLKEIYYQVTTGFKKRIASKYLEKGKWNEEIGIDILAQTILKNPRVPPIKNTERKSNGFITGECDVVYSDIIFDIKNNYDVLSHANAELTKLYETQLRGYMWLWNLNQAVLFPVLTNLPEHMMQAEERKLFYSGTEYLSFEDPAYIEECEKLRQEYNFERLPIEQRFKAFLVEHDDSFADTVKTRVLECRKWLNDYHQGQLDLYAQNRQLMTTI